MLDPEVNDWQTRRYEDDGVTNKYKCRIWVPTVSTQDLSQDWIFTLFSYYLEVGRSLM